MKRPDVPTTQSATVQGRVALLFWEGYLGISPSLVTGAKILAGAGYAVQIVTRERGDGYAALGILPPQISVVACVPLSRRLARLGLPGNLPDPEDRVGARSKGPFRRFRRAWQGCLLLADLLQFRWFARRRVPREWTTAVIGVDPLGLVAAAGVARRAGCRLVYWSLELYFLDRLRHPVLRLLKRFERALSRKARLVVVQDPGRADLLATENNLDRSRLAIVPNAPFGLPDVARSRLFHERFGLPPSSRVVLHLGMIGDEVLSRELAIAASAWSPSTHLVLHERFQRDPDEPYLRELVELGGGRVHLSLHPVPLDDLDRLVAAADVGLVLYRSDLGPNFANIAAASGKLAYYLRGGLPVVCLDLPGMREVVEGSGCGVCVGSPDEIVEALERIWPRYDECSRNAISCFLERYDASRFFAPVLAAIGTS